MGNSCHTDLIFLFCHHMATSSILVPLDKRKATKEEVYTLDRVHPENVERHSFGLNGKKNGKRQDEKEAALDNEVKNMGC